MYRVIHLCLFYCLFSVLIACKPLPPSVLSSDALSTSVPGASVTSTQLPAITAEAATLAADTAVTQPVPTKAATLSPTRTQTFGAISDMVCSPLQHETIASLAEIVSDPYKPPPPGRDERHQGVDFSYYHHGGRNTIEGEGIRSIMTGTVATVVLDRLPYGNMVIIETPASILPKEFLSAFQVSEEESLYHLYAHMQTFPLVQVGEVVECGQPLGTVGMTGYNIVNPHLHLETRIGPAGVKFTGMAFYTTDASIEEMENYQRWRTSGEFRHFDPMSIFAWFLEQ